MDSNIPPIQQTPEYRDFIKEFVAKKENVKHKLTSEINFHVDDLFQGMLTKFNSILRNSLPVPNGTSPSATTTTTTTTAATTNEPISVPILTPIPSYTVPSSTLQVVGASSIVPPGLLAGVYNNQNYNPQSALNLQQRQQQLLNPQLNQQLNQQLTQQSSQQTGQQLQHQQQQQNQQTSQQTSQQASQLLHPQPSQLLHPHQSILPQYYSNSSIAALNSMTNSGLSIPSLDEPASTISITRYQGDSQFFSATLDASNMLQIELKDESSNGGANDDLNIEDNLVLMNEDIESWELSVSDSECECEECTKRELQLGPKKKLTKKSARKYQKKDSDGSDGGTSSSSNGSSKVKIVRTMHVKCGQESCGDMFPHRSHLLVHAKQMHGIAPFRCLQGDCRQSFDTQISLDSHLEQSHSQTPEWFCIVCASFFKTYARLHAHEHNHHQKGMFRCSTCDFIGDLRSEVYEHYFNRHQSSTSGPNQNNQSSNSSKFNCRHPTCGKCFNRRENFQRHERVHLGIKPYLCRWPECCYASENSHAVIDHIRKKHFNQPKTKKDRIANNVEDGREPRQFLEVRRELVNASYHERIAVKVFGNHITKYF